MDCVTGFIITSVGYVLIGLGQAISQLSARPENYFEKDGHHNKKSDYKLSSQAISIKQPGIDGFNRFSDHRAEEYQFGTSNMPTDDLQKRTSWNKYPNNFDEHSGITLHNNYPQVYTSEESQIAGKNEKSYNSYSGHTTNSTSSHFFSLNTHSLPEKLHFLSKRGFDESLIQLRLGWKSYLGTVISLVGELLAISIGLFYFPIAIIVPLSIISIISLYIFYNLMNPNTRTPVKSYVYSSRLYQRLNHYLVREQHGLIQTFRNRTIDSEYNKVSKNDQRVISSLFQSIIYALLGSILVYIAFYDFRALDEAQIFYQNLGTSSTALVFIPTTMYLLSLILIVFAARNFDLGIFGTSTKKRDLFINGSSVREKHRTKNFKITQAIKQKLFNVAAFPQSQRSPLLFKSDIRSFVIYSLAASLIGGSSYILSKIMSTYFLVSSSNFAGIKRDSNGMPPVGDTLGGSTVAQASSNQQLTHPFSFLLISLMSSRDFHGSGVNIPGTISTAQLESLHLHSNTYHSHYACQTFVFALVVLNAVGIEYCKKKAMLSLFRYYQGNSSALGKINGTNTNSGFGLDHEKLRNFMLYSIITFLSFVYFFTVPLVIIIDCAIFNQFGSSQFTRSEFSSSSLFSIFPIRNSHLFSALFVIMSCSSFSFMIRSLSQIMKLANVENSDNSSKLD